MQECICSQAAVAVQHILLIQNVDSFIIHIKRSSLIKSISPSIVYLKNKSSTTISWAQWAFDIKAFKRNQIYLSILYSWLTLSIKFKDVPALDVARASSTLSSCWVFTLAPVADWNGDNHRAWGRKGFHPYTISINRKWYCCIYFLLLKSCGYTNRTYNITRYVFYFKCNVLWLLSCPHVSQLVM